MKRLYSNRILLNASPHAFGRLLVSQPDEFNVFELREKLKNNGYLFLRGFLDEFKIHNYNELIKSDFSKYSNRFNRLKNSYKDFKETRNCGHIPSIREFIKKGKITEFFSMIFGEPATPYDFIWSRVKGYGTAENCHCDIVYMQHGTHNLYTAWIPLMDIPLEMGPIMILDKSHCLAKLDSYRSLDIDDDRLKRMLVYKHGKFFRGFDYSKNPNEVQKEFGLKWLTADFHKGDILIFSADVLHCTLDNNSDKLRFSIDARFQAKSEPIDSRYVGENPTGHKSSKPLPYILKNTLKLF